ncbi:MAG TPA: hypothetical protein PK028_07440 [Bacteroidales bacterium]|mgnify:CR=1 FL=1|jgi:hypothetical protein|nr:MAG: hypothetical protein BWX51_01643 [Bacteroidetes bacterium ADurb.Bin012]HNQ60366.1 hypothetical protein [Bacteroidales bacterium]HNU22557.1 hypothetical protein [Bacteroidales bacterium]HNV17633.1 hypothetical protein [Bacteroidales bacterium]HNZ79769.1 hypothetical protein [Bacteroidales bacterium]
MNQSKTGIFVLPYTCKSVGYALIAVGIIWWVICQHFGITIRIPVFALISSFVSVKVFSIVQTNIVDEIALILMLAGCFLAVFSKERLESEMVNNIRYRSIFLALLINQLILLFSTLFFYGSAFIVVVLANIVLVSIIYLIILRIELQKIRHSDTTIENH